MTNRLELNWNLDGFVDEQRYYCSETSIDPENLPVPKAIIASGSRTYTDTAIEVGKTYYVCLSSVKNGIEKLSNVRMVVAGDQYTSNVVSLMHFDNDIVDEKDIVWTSTQTPQFTDSIVGFGKRLNLTGKIGVLYSENPIFRLQDADYTIECKIKANNFDKSNGVNPCIFSISNNHGPGSQEVFINIDSVTKKLLMRVYDNGYVVNEPSALAISENTEYTIALCKSGGKHYLFINGTLACYKEVATYMLADVVVRATIGGVRGDSVLTGRFDGYIDEFRFTKGVARYTENYIPSTMPFSL